MKSLELEDQTAEALLAQARMRGLPLSAFLRQMIAGTHPVTAPELLTADEMDSLIEASAGTFPPLPASFSRAEIYADHD